MTFESKDKPKWVPGMKVIVAGSRDITSYTIVKQVIESALVAFKGRIGEVVSGGARGVDTLGERYAKEMRVPVKLFMADWNTNGKAAGYIRNGEMADYADALIAVWDGVSKGTGHMIDQARQRHLRVFVAIVSITEPGIGDPGFSIHNSYEVNDDDVY